MTINRIYQISPDIILTHLKDNPKLHFPGEHRSFNIDWFTIQLLSVYTSADLENWKEFVSSYTEEFIQQKIDQLVKIGILAPLYAIKESESYKMINYWKSWGESASFLQLSSQNFKYLLTNEGADEFLRKASSPPPSYTCLCPDYSYDLLPPTKLNDEKLINTFLQRRSCRNFTGEPINLQRLSDLLFYTAGVLFANDTRFGPVFKKSAPSPGGRHATELYLAINKCEGIPSGFYHYCQKHHKLNLISKNEKIESFTNKALYGQEFFNNSAITIFYVSNVDRLMWKYKGSRNYRIMHFETGHYAQNFLLTGTSLGLGVFVTAAFNESTVESIFGIDGVNDVVMYVTGAGIMSPEGPYKRSNIEISEYLPKNYDLKLPASVKSMKGQPVIG